jgi:hypothetical protein
VPGRSVHPQSVHPFTFFSVSAFLSTRRGPCRSEAPSTARAAPGDHEPLIGGARWRSMSELRLGRSVTWSFCRWTYRQGTEGLVFYWPPIFDGLIFLPAYTVCFSKLPNSCQVAVRMSPSSTVQYVSTWIVHTRLDI